MIQLIERARARGTEIYADQYPYNTTGSDGEMVLIPEWVFVDSSSGKNFVSALRRVLASPDQAQKLRRDVAFEIGRRGDAENIYVFDHPNQRTIGRNVLELARERGIDAVEMAINLQLEGYADRRGGARLRGFSLSEIDLDAYAGQPWVATASDAAVVLPEDGPAVHPRYYGTFPRKLVYYAMRRGVLTIEAAIRSMTSLPAQVLRLPERGLLREGHAADVVIIDLARLAEQATYTDPHRQVRGVDWVITNGKTVVEDGRPTGALPGQVLMPRRSAKE